MNLITAARNSEETCKQGFLLFEPKTHGLTPTLPRQVFWVLLQALCFYVQILVHRTYGLMSIPFAHDYMQLHVCSLKPMVHDVCALR